MTRQITSSFSTLPANSVQANLSYAYLAAVTSMAGYALQMTNMDADGLGIDGLVIGNAGDVPNARLAVQVKSTTNYSTLADGTFSYQLKNIKTYKDCCSYHSRAPIILCVYIMPSLDSDWIAQDEGGLTLSHGMYWVPLYNAPSLPPKQQSVSVKFSSDNFLTSDLLKQLMLRSAEGFDMLTGKPI